MLLQRNTYCDSDDPCSADGLCTRLADHDGDHYDAATDRRWHNWSDNYGPQP